MTRRFQWIAGFALAVVLVYWFLRQADLSQVASQLRGIELRFVAAACGTVLLSSLQRAFRWRRILARFGRFSIRDLWECLAMGWAVSTLLPGRFGEVARGVLLARRTQVGAAAAVGSVALERVLDLGALLLLLAGYLLLAPAPAELTAGGVATLAGLRSVGMSMLAGLVLGMAVAVTVARSARLRARWMGRVERVLPSALARLAAGFLTGLVGIRSRLALLEIVVASLLLWGTIAGTYVLLFHALHVDVAWYASIPLLAMVVVGAAVPTPAGAGSFHALAQLTLTGVFAVANDTAVAYAIVSHLVAFLPMAAIGSALLLREGVSAARLWQMTRRARAGEEPRGTV